MYAGEGVDLNQSTLTDQDGCSSALLVPLADAIGRMFRRGVAISANDTPVKMQAPGSAKTRTARVWNYVRDERP